MKMIVIICDGDSSPPALALKEWSEGFRSAQFQADAYNRMDIVLVTRRVFLAVNTRKVIRTNVENAETRDDASFCEVAFHIVPCQTAVAVGICDVQPTEGYVPRWIREAIWWSVVDRGLHCVTGVFGRLSGP